MISLTKAVSCHARRVGPPVLATLRKPVYAGRLEVTGLDVRARGDFEPLVDGATFDRVQAILDGRAHAIVPHLRSRPDFPLRHFVKCGLCERRLTGSWSRGRPGTRYAYCRCPGCQKVKHLRERLEASFVALLKGLQPQPGYLRLFRAVALDVWRQRQSETGSLRKAAERRVEEIRANLIGSMRLRPQPENR